MTDSETQDWSDLSPSERPYHRVTLPNPEEKDFEEYSTNERRAWILEQIRDEYRIPSEVPRVELGKQFGVTHSTIYQDVEILKDYMSEYVAADFESEAVSVFRHAINRLSEEDPFQAVKTVEKWSEWLENRGEIENESTDTVAIESSDDVDMSFNIVSGSDSDSDQDSEEGE